MTINDVNPSTTPIVLKDPDGDGEEGVNPGEGFEVKVTYQSELTGEDTSELAIKNNSSIDTINVPLVANGASACIRVTPDIVDFGLGLLGGRNPQSVAIQSCGSEPLRISAIRLEGIEADGDATANALQPVPFFSLDEQSVPPLPFTLPPRPVNAEADLPSESLIVFFTPTEEIPYNATLVIENNDPITPALELPVRGRGADNQCPEARVTEEQIVVKVNDTVILDGGPSRDEDANDGRPIRYDWAFVQRPAESTAVALESFADPLRPDLGGEQDDSATAKAVFYADKAGEYLVDLTVTDRLGATAPSAPCPQPAARVRVIAEGRADLHVEMFWDTPDDADQDDVKGADMDLHLRHPSAQSWFDDPYDCSYQNPRPDWGALNQTVDDPRLDADDADRPARKISH